MTVRPLDPRRCSVAIDANALNLDGSAHDGLVACLLELHTAGTIKLMMTKGVRGELRDSRTPADLWAVTEPLIFSLPVGLNRQEQKRRQIMEEELQGNARSGKHRADADHLFEAAKYGGYFITHDERILTRSGRLRDVLPATLTVITLAGFLEVFDDYVAGRRI